MLRAWSAPRNPTCFAQKKWKGGDRGGCKEKYKLRTADSHLLTVAGSVLAVHGGAPS